MGHIFRCTSSVRDVCAVESGLLLLVENVRVLQEVEWSERVAPYRRQQVVQAARHISQNNEDDEDSTQKLNSDLSRKCFLFNILNILIIEKNNKHLNVKLMPAFETCFCWKKEIHGKL